MTATIIADSTSSRVKKIGNRTSMQKNNSRMLKEVKEKEKCEKIPKSRNSVDVHLNASLPKDKEEYDHACFQRLRIEDSDNVMMIVMMRWGDEDDVR